VPLALFLAFGVVVRLSGCWWVGTDPDFHQDGSVWGVSLALGDWGVKRHTAFSSGRHRMTWNRMCVTWPSVHSMKEGRIRSRHGKEFNKDAI
jgi:hypothetical protein